MNDRKSLLIVDDDEVFLNRLGRSMERKGFTPTLASSVSEGKRRAAESAPDYAVIDLRLQDGNGLEVVEAIRKVNEEASIVMLTGYGNIASAVAAARRGWTEELIMRMSDFSFAFPAILSAIMLTAIFGPGGVNSILAIGLYNIPVFARLTRGSANAIWAREFVMAARAAGKGRLRITFEHILPNILSIIIVQATILFAIAILAEAALSYLGLGTQPPDPSWGRMLNEAQKLMFLQPMQAVYPGLAIAIAVFGLNLLGDGLRDVLDPRLSRKR